MIFRQRARVKLLALSITCLCSISVSVLAKTYSLDEAVASAQNNDPWLEGSRLQEQKLAALSISAGSLPDPTMSLGFANVPVDSFDLDQEPMTQIVLGLNQMFPRGRTLSLQKERLEKLSQIQPSMRADRLAQTALRVAHLWLDIYRNQKTISLIEKDRGLFEHLVDVAESSYTTASGRTRQQDLVRAQLELTRLEDRLSQLQQMKEATIAQLGGWLINHDLDLNITWESAPDLLFAAPNLVGQPKNAAAQQRLLALLGAHPKIKAVDQKINAEETAVSLSKQSYKPQWGVNASYGVRDDDPTGAKRADFFSVGLSVDVPLFGAKRQDNQVQAAIATKEAVKTERALLQRQLRAGFEAAEASYLRLIERKTLFKERLLKQMAEQADAALAAYTSGDGDFSEVVRARISELNARIDALNIDVEIQKLIAQINYFFAAENSFFSSVSANPVSTKKPNDFVTGGRYE